MYQQGFLRVASLGSPTRELAYPHIHLTFLRPALMYLDTGQATPEVKAAAAVVVPEAPVKMLKPPVAPFSPAPAVAPPAPVRPAVPAPSPAELAHEQASRLLKVARLYIEAKQYDSARSKLNELIKKYPQDADAATARDLLGQLPQP
jgi:TolA-binding protein